MKALRPFALGLLLIPAHLSAAGTIHISPGAKLTVNGTVTAGTVQGEPTSTLAGDGVITAETILNGTLSPGPGFATLTTGDLTVDPSATVEIELDNNLATAGVDYDHILVSGAITLSGGDLALMDRGYSATLGQQLTLLHNDGSDPITGSFSGLAEGAALPFPGTTAVASVTYLGGDGNDMVLTMIADTNGNGTIVTLADLSTLATDGIIDRSELSSGLVLGGTVGNGSDGLTVTISVGGLEVTTIATGGTWSITLDDGSSGIPGALDISNLSDGPVTVTADMIDLGGYNAAQASDIFELDIVDTLAIDTPIAGDNRVNASELTSGIPLTGTSEVEPGQILTLTFEDSLGAIVEAPAMLQSDGTWSLDLGVIDQVSDKPLADEANKERDPEIAILKDGGWILTWWVSGDGSDGTDLEIYYQRFAAGGTAIGNPVKVDASDSADDNDVVVAALEDGGWIIAWTSFGDLGDGTDKEIAMQRYDNLGNPIGGNVRVNEANSTNDGQATVTGLSDGGWLIAWAGHGVGGDGTDQEIIAQRYDSDGLPDGGAVKLDDPDGNRVDASPAITVMPNGTWLLGWQGWDATQGNWDAYYKLFDATGVALTTDLSLNDEVDDSSHETGVQVAALQDNEWVVTWRDSVASNYSFRHFTSAGTAAASGVLITTGTPIERSALSPLNDGGWIASWSMSDDGPDTEIYSQRFDTSGTPIGTNTLVSNQDDGTDTRPMTVPLPGGGWLTAWECGGALCGQYFAPNGDPLPDSIALTSLAEGPVSINATINNLGGTSYPATASFTIDTTPPVMALSGNPSITIDWGEAWSDPGVSANDNLDGVVAVTTGGDIVSPTVPGIYLVTYDASDAAGNAASQVTRTITIRSAHESWAIAKGLTIGVNDSFLDDPDGDGCPNGKEFALDGDPLSLVPSGKLRSTLADFSGSIHLTMTIPVRSGAVFGGSTPLTATIDGVTYEVEGTIDLQSYQAVIEEVTPALDTGLPALSPGWEYRSFRHADDTTNHLQAFIRLGISESP